MREGFWACCTFPGAKFHSLGSALGRQQTKAHPGLVGTVKVTSSVAGVCGSRDKPHTTALIPGGLFVGSGIIVAVTRNFKDVELLCSAHTWGVNRSPHQGWGGAGLRESGRMSFEPLGCRVGAGRRRVAAFRVQGDTCVFWGQVLDREATTDFRQALR